MKSSILRTALALSLLSSAYAHEITKILFCGYACVNALDSLNFTSTTPELTYYGMLCNETLRTQSMYLCMKAYCTEQELHDGIKLYEEECEEVEFKVPSYESIMTPELLSTLTNKSHYLDYPSFASSNIYRGKGTPVFDIPVVPDSNLFNLGYRTLSTWYTVYASHHSYGAGMVGYWAFVLLIGMTFRFLSWTSYLFNIRKPVDPESQSVKPRSPLGKFVALYRRHLGLPASFGLSHQQSKGWFTVPTRIQGLCVWIFLILNIAACTASYYTFRDNLYWAEEKRQLWRYVADRTGIIAYFNLPLVFLFAVRNNLFLWLSGWNFATFNVFHRWVARIVVIQAILHSIFYTVIIFAEGGKAEYVEYIKDGSWFWTGIMATVFFSVLIPLSMYWIRSKIYELFLRLHIALSVGVIVCLFYHTAIFEGEYDPYLWACVGVWSFDRLITVIRLAILNFKVLFRRHSASVEYHADQDIMRIRVPPSFHRKPVPGSYYFLYFPTMWRGWESHPFTLSSWTDSDIAGSSSLQCIDSDNSGRSSPVTEKKDTTVVAVSSPVDSTADFPASTGGPLELSFLVKPYNGFTAALRNRVAAAGNTKSMTILLEGPYGMPHHLHRYENLVLIAGGSGIAAIIPYVHSLLSKGSGIGSSPKVRTKKIHIVFSSRQAQFVRDVMATELLHASKRSEVTIELAVTKGDKEMGELDATLRNSPRTKLQYGRVDIASVIHNQVDQAVGDLAIFVCGPARLGDRARRTVVEITGRTKSNDVHFFEEYFGW